MESLQGLRRLKLEDVLASPMQRLTKYHLMLKAVLKNTLDPETKSSLHMMVGFFPSPSDPPSVHQ